MLHAYAYPAGGSVTGPSSTNQHGLSHQELAALRQRKIRAYQASIASARQRCSDAYDQLATSVERIARSQDILATNQRKFGRGTRERQPLPHG